MITSGIPVYTSSSSSIIMCIILLNFILMYVVGPSIKQNDKSVAPKNKRASSLHDTQITEMDGYLIRDFFHTFVLDQVGTLLIQTRLFHCIIFSFSLAYREAFLYL